MIEEWMQKAAEQMVWENSVLNVLAVLLFVVASCVAMKLMQALVIRRLRAAAKKTKTTLDDFLLRTVSKIVMPAVYFGVVYIASTALVLPEVIRKGMCVVGLAVVTLFITKVCLAVINYSFERYWKRRGQDIVLEQSLSGIMRIVNLIIWAIAISLFLDNLGFQISAVIAGLGIGGVAVALAAQAVLGDLFSYFAIIFDRPFEVGDFIIIGDFLGTVEHIGIKTTRISSLGGEQLIFSNTDLTNSRVRNYKRMEKRRVLFKIGVTYQTTQEQCKRIPVLLKDIVENVSGTTFDRAHFSSYGDFSLNFEIVYYVNNPDYNVYMDTQQEINFLIKERFAKEGVEFAYPTQTLFVTKEN